MKLENVTTEKIEELTSAIEHTPELMDLHKIEELEEAAHEEKQRLKWVIEGEDHRLKAIEKLMENSPDPFGEEFEELLEKEQKQLRKLDDLGLRRLWTHLLEVEAADVLEK